MRVLGFDCSTDDTVIAAYREGEAVFESRTGAGPHGRPEHSRALLKGVEAAAAELGGWQAVDRIAVGLGPGTFTGLRIAAATASGLSLSTGAPAVGVSTLEAMARALSGGDSAAVPVLDAKRGEVFIAAYGTDGAELLPPAALAPDDAIESIRSLGCLVRVGGPGAVRFRDLFSGAGVRVEDPESEQGRLSGVAICEIGAAAQIPMPDEPLEPFYIREPDAKLWLDRDSPRPIP